MAKNPNDPEYNGYKYTPGGKGKKANETMNPGAKPKRKTIGGSKVVIKSTGPMSKPLTLRQAALRNPVKRGR